MGPTEPPPNNVPFTVRFVMETFVNDALREEKFPGITTISELVPIITWFADVHIEYAPIAVEFE